MKGLSCHLPKRRLVDFRLDPSSGVYLPPGATEHFAYSDGESEEKTLLHILQSAQDRSTTSDTLRNEKRGIGPRSIIAPR